MFVGFTKPIMREDKESDTAEMEEVFKKTTGVFMWGKDGTHAPSST
jgi:hypothetical protein